MLGCHVTHGRIVGVKWLGEDVDMCVGNDDKQLAAVAVDSLLEKAKLIQQEVYVVTFIDKECIKLGGSEQQHLVCTDAVAIH